MEPEPTVTTAPCRWERMEESSEWNSHLTIWGKMVVRYYFYNLWSSNALELIWLSSSFTDILRMLLKNSPNTMYDTSKPTTPKKERTMSVDWRDSMKPQVSMTSLQESLTAGPVSEFLAKWQRKRRATWRTDDPPQTVIPTLWRKSLSGPRVLTRHCLNSVSMFVHVLILLCL